jgi:hypothetical protein
MDRWEQRQEHIISAVHGLADVIETNNAMIMEVAKWLQEPPSSAVPDTLRMLVEAVNSMTEVLTSLIDRIEHEGKAR